MIHIEPGVYVRIEELPGRPHPLPLQSGFSTARAYRVLGIHSPSETSECYFILSNDRNEVWFISNRHCRTVAIAAARGEFNFTLPDNGLDEVSLHAA